MNQITGPRWKLTLSLTLMVLLVFFIGVRRSAVRYLARSETE